MPRLPFRIIVFLKAPRPGRVKTRLIPALGARGAAAFYRAMASDLMDRLSGVEGATIEVRFAPADDRSMVRRWLGNRYALAPQHGTTLGARMANAFRAAFREGCSRCLIVGTDVPELDASLLAQALAQLSRTDLVLGPSHDGGYYLVGLREPRPALFSRMTWSTDRVLAQTVQRAAALGLRVRLLRQLTDVDGPEDLAGLQTRWSRRAVLRRGSPRLGAWLATNDRVGATARAGEVRDPSATTRRRDRASSSRRAASSR